MITNNVFEAADEVCFGDVVVEVLTGCGPMGDAISPEISTGIWISERFLFLWDWADEASAAQGHRNIVALLKAVAGVNAKNKIFEDLFQIILEEEIKPCLTD